MFKVDLALTRLYHCLKHRQQKLLLLTGKGQKRSFTHPWKLSAALLALEPKVQRGLTCGHASPAEIAKNMPRTLTVFYLWESEREGQSHRLIQEAKVDGLMLVTAIAAKLDSIQNSNCSSCSGNLTGGFSDLAFTGVKKTARSLTAIQLKACINNKQEGTVFGFLSAPGPTTAAHESHALHLISGLSSTKPVGFHPEKFCKVWWVVAAAFRKNVWFHTISRLVRKSMFLREFPFVYCAVKLINFTWQCYILKLEISFFF